MLFVFVVLLCIAYRFNCIIKQWPSTLSTRNQITNRPIPYDSAMSGEPRRQTLSGIGTFERICTNEMYSIKLSLIEVITLNSKEREREKLPLFRIITNHILQRQFFYAFEHIFRWTPSIIIGTLTARIQIFRVHLRCSGLNCAWICIVTLNLRHFGHSNHEQPKWTRSELNSFDNETNVNETVQRCVSYYRNE